jgi:hypothetical protein
MTRWLIRALLLGGAVALGIGTLVLVQRGGDDADAEE